MKKLTLLTNLLLILFSTGAAVADTQRGDDEKALALEIYKQFVEIPSGFSTGSTTTVAQAAAARLKAAGFADADIFVGGASPGKANLVVRYHGTGARKPILLLAHTDVVEAKRSDWNTDPFKFEQRDGYFYGRGTSDDKAQAAVWIANLIEYKREGFKPDRDIIVALTADEEGQSPYNGVAWLLKNHRELIDADFALNEGGGGESSANKKIANNIQISEKYVINFRFEVRNKGGHSSIPVADNAIYRLAEALHKVSQFKFPTQLNVVTTAYFDKMAKIDTSPVRFDLANIANNNVESIQKVSEYSPYWNATLRTTCVATMLEGGHATNALPQLAAANVNCRVMPDESPEYVLHTLQKLVDDDHVTIQRVGDFGKGPSSPMRQDVLQAVAQQTTAVWPGVPIVPTMVMGATDGRFLRAAGIPTYGVSGFFEDRDDIRAHGRDERMGVQAFYEGQAFLYQLVKQLCT
jgi:acetylornithine deacetylase/succinyl-diaminopimelate desuccinylase-like protein